MRIHINHTTRYSYNESVKHSIQCLRLTPQTLAHQRVLSWRMTLPRLSSEVYDGFGNRVLSTEGLTDVGGLAAGVTAGNAPQVTMYKFDERNLLVGQARLSVTFTRPLARDYTIKSANELWIGAPLEEWNRARLMSLYGGIYSALPSPQQFVADGGTLQDWGVISLKLAAHQYELKREALDYIDGANPYQTQANPKGYLLLQTGASVQTYQYDERGRRIESRSTTRVNADPQSASTDWLWQRSSEDVYAPAVLERTRYGLGGQVVFSGTGYDLHDGKAVLRSTTFGYDLMGHKVAEVSAGGSSQLWRFNAQGQLYRYVDTGGASTISEYEEGTQQLKRKVTASINTQSLVQEDYTYDEAGQLTDLVRDEFTQEANLIVSERVRTVTQTRYDLNGLKVAKRVEVSRDEIGRASCRERV